MVFSRLDLPPAKALEVVLRARLAAFVERHPKPATAWACTVVARGPKGVKRPPETETVFVIDPVPAELEKDPVAVSMTRMLLERGDPIDVDWDGTRQEAGEALTMLDALEGSAALEGFDEDDAPEADQDEEETLFERVLEAMLDASEDMERGLELKEAIEEASPKARAWMEYVVRNNNVASDEMVDRALQLEPATAARVHEEIEALLAEL